MAAPFSPGFGIAALTLYYVARLTLQISIGIEKCRFVMSRQKGRTIVPTSVYFLSLPETGASPANKKKKAETCSLAKKAASTTQPFTETPITEEEPN